jgi:hypothetical protein
MFLKNKDKSASFEFIETHREGDKTFVVLSSADEKDADKVYYQAKGLGYQYIGTCMRDGKPTVAFASDKPEQEVIQEFSGGKELEKVGVAKPPNMWFWRGLMGLTGQTLNLGHSKFTGDKGLGFFAVLNIVANTMAMVFGAQKRNDLTALKNLNNEFDHITAEGGGRLDVGEHVTKAQDEFQRAHPEKLDEVAKEKQGIMGWVRSNSVKIQHALRLVASAGLGVSSFMTFKDPNASAAAKERAVTRLISSSLILPGKLIGMVAQDDDPTLLPQEKRGAWKSFKNNANQIGSLIELTGFTLLAYDGIKGSHKMKVAESGMTKAQEIGKKLNVENGWMQAGGQSLFVASYMMQSVAPLSKKVFPTERALQSAAWHLQTVPDEKRDQTALSMAMEMYRGVPVVRNDGLAKILGRIYKTAELPVYTAEPLAAPATEIEAPAQAVAEAAPTQEPAKEQAAAPTALGSMVQKLAQETRANVEAQDRQPANPAKEVLAQAEAVAAGGEKTWAKQVDAKRQDEQALALK